MNTEVNVTVFNSVCVFFVDKCLNDVDDFWDMVRNSWTCISKTNIQPLQVVIVFVFIFSGNFFKSDAFFDRTFDNFIVNLLSGIAAYCCFPKKPCINVSRTVDTQLALF